MGMNNPLIARLGKMLSLEEAEILVRATRTSTAIAARQSIGRDGEELSGIRVLMEGVACRVRAMPGGRRAIVGYVMPGEVCDLSAVLSGKRRNGILSLTPCQVAEIPRNVFTELCARTSFLRALLAMAAGEEAILREWLANMGQERADRRVAHMLCELRLRLEAAGLCRNSVLHLPVTQEELGESLGISTVHVNRVLQKLRADGLIQFRGRSMVIPDVGKLEAFAEFDPGYLMLPVPEPQRSFRAPSTPAMGLREAVVGTRGDAPARAEITS
jgi:CRP-like cAMP-binding protein